jgi:hypothetical protein
MTHIFFALIVVCLVCLTVYIKRKTKELEKFKERYEDSILPQQSNEVEEINRRIENLRMEFLSLRREVTSMVDKEGNYLHVGGVYKHSVYD